MPTPHSQLRLIVLQIRSDRKPLLQEQACFIECAGLSPKQMSFINLVDEPEIRWRHVESAHAVVIGGAGNFSVTDKQPFTAPLTDVVLRLVDADRPIFGSCYGHQFLASVLGGEVVTDRERTELGSQYVELSEVGASDPLFENIPRRFSVQIGHSDRVSALGPDLQELAYSTVCPNQIIRLRDKPVYGTQFHSEMDEDRLRERLEVYREEYAPDPEEFASVISALRPSVEADKFFKNFLSLYA